MSESLPEALLMQDRQHVQNKHESESWDYKEDLDVSNPLHVGKLARHVLAFHNAGGGVIFVGVENRTGKVVGIPYSRICEPHDLRGKLQRYIGPSINVFSEQIDLPNRNNRCIWAIFIPKHREGAQKQWARVAGPDRKAGERPDPVKGAYYLRMADESVLVSDPQHLQDLIGGGRLSAVHAYTFDVDEAYTRLFTRHYQRLIGRDDDLAKLRSKVLGRQPVIEIEGYGGIGKTSIAVELTHQMYKERLFDVIISISAKKRVWDGRDASKRSMFASLREFLTDIGVCLGADVARETDELEEDIREHLRGLNSLFLVDNLEDVRDRDLISFLADRMAEWEGVKIIVTSRVERLGVPFPLTALGQEASRELLRQELDEVSVRWREMEWSAPIDDIVAHTYGNPLFIKWAAQLARNTALPEVSRSIRANSRQRDELMNFCFHSMYEDLGQQVREIALVLNYLQAYRSVPVVAFAMDIRETVVVDAIGELQRRNIVSGADPESGVEFHAMTGKYLEIEWNKAAKLRARVAENLDGADLDGRDDALADMWLRLAKKQFAENRLDRAKTALACATPHLTQKMELAVDVLKLRVRIAERQGAPTEALAAAREGFRLRKTLGQSGYDIVVMYARLLASSARHEEKQEALVITAESLQGMGGDSLQVLKHARDLAQICADVVQALRAYLAAQKLFVSCLEFEVACLALADAFRTLLPEEGFVSVAGETYLRLVDRANFVARTSGLPISISARQVTEWIRGKH